MQYDGKRVEDEKRRTTGGGIKKQRVHSFRNIVVNQFARNCFRFAVILAVYIDFGCFEPIPKINDICK
jgi:hypothetical protein